MTCETFKIGDLRGIVCSRGRKTKAQRRLCCKPGCSDPGVLQCDFPVSQKKTCDAYVCVDHATEVGPNRHYCPTHRIRSEKTSQLNLFKKEV